MYDCIGSIQQVYKKKFNDVLIWYGETDENSNIYFINEGKYHSKENSEENYLIISSTLRFDGLS